MELVHHLHSTLASERCHADIHCFLYDQTLYNWNWKHVHVSSEKVWVSRLCDAEDAIRSADMCEAGVPQDLEIVFCNDASLGAVRYYIN